MYALFSHSWSGLIVVAIVAALAWVIVRTAARWKRRRVRFIGYSLYALAGLLAVGSVIAIVRIGLVEAKYPPMGKLVDVNGHRLHILAEGEASGLPTLVWIPGGHAPGLAFYGHHLQLREEARSILFDRAGTGWSDTGPFPRRTAIEAEELAILLDRAGERGPFILIGHSYGGLLAANYARRHPDRIAAVVLLDATQPDMLAYNRYLDGDGFGLMARLHRLQGVLKLFGIRFDPYRKLARSNPQIARLQRLYDEYLGDMRGVFEAQQVRPASDWAAASLFSELDAGQIAHTALQLMVYDAELGALPLCVVVPQGDLSAIVERHGSNPAQRQRILDVTQRMRERYARASTQSKLLHAPPGTGHNFPYETPQYVTNLVRGILRSSRVGSSSCVY